MGILIEPDKFLDSTIVYWENLKSLPQPDDDPAIDYFYQVGPAFREGLSGGTDS